jgi:gas vesicle protein
MSVADAYARLQAERLFSMMRASTSAAVRLHALSCFVYIIKFYVRTDAYARVQADRLSSMIEHLRLCTSGNNTEHFKAFTVQAVKDTVLGTSDAAAEKAKDAKEQIQNTAASAGHSSQDAVKQAKDSASNTAKQVHQSVQDIAEEAQHAWETQHGESAWQKVG